MRRRGGLGRRGAVVVVTLLIASAVARAEAAAGTEAVELQSWAQFSDFFPGDAVGAEWYVTPGARHAVTVGQLREAGRSRWEIVYLRHDRQGMTARRIVGADDGGRFGKAIIRTVSGRLTVVAASYSSRSAEPHRLRFFDLESLVTRGMSAPRAAGSVQIAGFVREADWDLVEVGDEAWLVRAAGGRIVGSVVSWSDAETLLVSEPWDLVHGRSSVSIPAVSYDRGSGRLAAAWIEPSTGGETVMRAGVAENPAPGAVLTLVGESPFGFAEPYRPGAANQSDALGSRVTYDTRRSIALRQEPKRLLVAGSRIVRQRSPLSDYSVQPVVVELALDAASKRVEPVTDRDGAVPRVPARVIEIDEPAAGVVDGSFQLVGCGDGVVVSFLREYPGPEVRSTFYAAMLDGSGARRPTAAIETTRRITSPHLFDGGRAALWIQLDPNRNAWQAGYQDDRPSYLRKIGVPWRGSTGETIAAVVISLPLAVVMTLFWATLSNAPLIALVAALALLLFRFAPNLARERYLVCLAALTAVAAALVGDSAVSLGGPQPALAFRGLGFALVLAAAAWERRHIPAVPGPGMLIGWAYRTLVVVIALPSYAATLAIMR